VKLTDARTGDFTYDSESSDGEPVTFTFTVSDGQATSEPADGW